MVNCLLKMKHPCFFHHLCLFLLQVWVLRHCVMPLGWLVLLSAVKACLRCGSGLQLLSPWDYMRLQLTSMQWRVLASCCHCILRWRRRCG